MPSSVSPNCAPGSTGFQPVPLFHALRCCRGGFTPPSSLWQLSPEKFAAEITRRTIADAQASIDAASIVFTHSVVDATALDYCRVTALVAPRDWESSVDQRQVKLTDFRGKDYDQVLRQKLDEFFEQLERESLLKKTDLLFAKCQPPKDWAPIGHYQFDRERLQKLDEVRHEIVHGSALGKEITRC